MGLLLWQQALLLLLLPLLFAAVSVARAQEPEVASKTALWRELLSEQVAPETGASQAALEELANRLGALPDQRQAALLYLQLSSASNTATCQRRTSLAQLSAGSLAGGAAGSGLEAARARVQQDELPEGALSSAEQDPQVANWLALAQNLALDNANLLSRLGLHAPGLASEFVANEHFSKYLLESCLPNQRPRKTSSSSSSAAALDDTPPLQFAGLLFYKPSSAAGALDGAPPQVEFGWLAEPAAPRARLINPLLENATRAYFRLDHLALPLYARWALAVDELEAGLAQSLAEGASLEPSDGRWFSAYRDCGLSQRWLLAYSVPLFARLEGRPVFRGVSFVALDLARLGLLDQCAPPGPEEGAQLAAAAAANQCRRLAGSKCVRQPGIAGANGWPLLGGYLCACPPGAQVELEEATRAASARAQLELEALLWAQRHAVPLNLLPLDQLAGSSPPPPPPPQTRDLGPQLQNAGHHFQAGPQLEAEAALTWLLGWPEAKWPALSCRACAPAATIGSAHNDSTQACLGQPDAAAAASWHPIRPLAAGLQAAGSLLMLLLLALLVRLRKSRVIIASGRLMLSTTLLGALLLYSSVLVRSLLRPSARPVGLACLLETWFRQLGFASFYGSLLIKLYRIYTEFQTRKAHRVCLRDRDQMAYLAALALIVLSYLSAWTALVLDGFLVSGCPSKAPTHLQTEQLFAGLVERVQQQQHHWDLRHHILSASVGGAARCRKLNWDYVTELNEMGLLLFGLYLIYKLRNASSKAHQEKLVLSAAFLLELLVSGATYAARHALWDRLSGDQLLLLLCVRCQLTVTPTLALVFGPKLWSICRSRQWALFGALKGASNNASLRHRCHITCELHDHHLNDAMRLHQAMLSSATLDIGSINLVDMSPDEIKAELKRVYAQLELLKNKAMRRDNPHISRRRGGRKPAGHRKFSLQAFHPRHIGVGGLAGKQQPGSQHSAAQHQPTSAARTLDELEEEQEEQEEAEAEANEVEADETEETSRAGDILLLGLADSTPGPLPAANAAAASLGPAARKASQAATRAKPGPARPAKAACFTDDPTFVMINDSQSSGNASPREIQSSSFVCSQSSIQPDDSSASSLNNKTAGFTSNCT